MGSWFHGRLVGSWFHGRLVGSWFYGRLGSSWLVGSWLVVLSIVRSVGQCNVQNLLLLFVYSIILTLCYGLR